jgi:succinoglycan biosynthesis protein ExoU
VKAEGGKGAAIRHLLANPAAAPAVIGGVLGDKLEAMRNKGTVPQPVPEGKLRYLLPGVPVAQR